MISKKDKKKAFELIKLMQKQPHKGVSSDEASSFCTEDNFTEIIKFLKYSDLIESGVHPQYILTNKGYHHTKFKHAVNYLKKNMIFLSILVGFIIQGFTIYKIVTENILKEKEINKLKQKIDDLESEINKNYKLPTALD